MGRMTAEAGITVPLTVVHWSRIYREDRSVFENAEVGWWHHRRAVGMSLKKIEHVMQTCRIASDGGVQQQR